MRTSSALCLLASLPLCALVACGESGPGHHGEGHGSGLEARPGRAPHSGVDRRIQWPTRPPKRVEEPPPNPEEQAAQTEALDEKRAALADVGRYAFDALRTGEFEDLLDLTPLADTSLADDCADMPTKPKRELEARFDYCHEQIDWGAVAEAQIFAGKPSGDPAPGCGEGIEDYGRLQLFLHMKDETIWRVEFYGAVGREGKAVGIDGSINCKQVDEAPPL